MRLFVLVSWPYVRRHLVRYCLLAAGVALGVSVAVVMQGGTQSVVAGFRQTVERIAGSCQLQVSAGEAGVPEAFLEQLQAVPQVRGASPVIEVLTDSEPDGAGRMLIVGVDMTGDAQMRPWLSHATEGPSGVDPVTFLAQPDSILLHRRFAARKGWRIGSKFTLKTMAGPRAFTVRGLLDDEGLDRIFGGNVAVMDVYGAQHVFGRGRSVDRIDIVLAEDCTLEEGRAAIRKAIGAGYSVEPPTARGEQFEDLLRAYAALQIMACLFAVALGICMIDGAFRLAVTQRRAEIGILRCLGATRRQVQTVFLLEGAVTGILGSALGLVLGTVFFSMLARTTEGLFRGAFGGLTEQSYQFEMSPAIVALAFAMGVGISVIASWIPAREAARARPAEAFRPMQFERAAQPWRPRALMFSALLACGAVIGNLQRGSALIFYSSMVILFLAVVAAIPSLVPWMVRPLRPWIGGRWGAEGALALDSLTRTPRRSITTVAVLLLVFAQTVMIGGIHRSTTRAVELWIRRAFPSDLVLTSSANLASRAYRFPPGFDEILRGVPGVASVQPVRTVHVPFHGHPVLVIASGYRDGLSISGTLALRERLGPGSEVELVAPAGTLRLPVRGIVNDYSDRQGVIFLPQALYQHYWNDLTFDKFHIDAASGVPAVDVRARLRQTLGDRYPASILTRDEVREYTFHPRGQALSPLDMQILLSIVIGVLALMNMASISIAERTREFALLRSVGAYRSQVKRSLCIELLVTGGISLLLGLAVGALLLFYLLSAVERYITGIRLEYCFPWSTSASLVGVAAIAGVVVVSAAAPALARLPLSVALDAE